MYSSIMTIQKENFRCGVLRTVVTESENGIKLTHPPSLLFSDFWD